MTERTDIELRRRLERLDLEVACALDLPGAERRLLTEVDRVVTRKKLLREWLGIGACLGTGFLERS